MTDASRRLVLWDIDHTLLVAHQVHLRVWRDVCSQLSGRPVEELGATHGQTEPQVLVDALLLAGISQSRAQQLLPCALRRTTTELAARTDELRAHGRTLPGARAALAALHAHPEVTQSVLTGNIEPNAVLKLRVFELDRYLDLAVGAYGSDDAYRPNLVRVARERAEALRGLTFDRSTTILVGDAVLDVEAGRRGGARVVAVATGGFDSAALCDAGADVVLTDLRDTQRVLQAILDPNGV